MFAVAEDLLIGDTLITSKIDLDFYVQQGYEAMCLALADCYALPLPPVDEIDDEDTKKKLKQIQVHFATSYLFRAQAGTNGDERSTEYAKWLLKQAEMWVEGVCSTNPGLRLNLPAATPLNGDDGTDPNIPASSASPSLLLSDDRSPMDDYYDRLSSRRDYYGVRPGW